MTYDLRRLRLHGLIERIPKSHRYQVTDLGYRAALLLHRTYARTIRPTLSAAQDPRYPNRLRRALDHVDEIERIWRENRIAA